MKHLMIDVETLDTRPTAVVLSVAMLAFDPATRGQQEMLCINLDVAEQLAQGRTMSLDTVKWWMQQSIEARAKAFASPTSHTVGMARESVIDTINTAEHIWANDPDFDCVILRDLIGYDSKWPFWKHRSCRTMKAFDPDKYGQYQASDFVAHAPMEDCKKQAWHIMNVWPANEILPQ